MRGARTTAKVVLFVAGGLTTVFGASAWFAAGVAYDDRVLEATFGAGMGLLSIALTLLVQRGRDVVAWWALWLLPVFFAVHVALLGTWLPDAVFCLLSAGALLVLRPSEQVSDGSAVRARASVAA